MQHLSNEIEIDRLSAEEIQELDSYKQLILLTEIGQEIKRLADLLTEAIETRFELRCEYLDDPTLKSKKNTEKADTLIKKLKEHIAARKFQASCLQTVMRVTPH